MIPSIPRSTFLLCVLGASVPLLKGCSPPRDLSAEEIFAKSCESVVKVYGLSSSPDGNRAGTGFVVQLGGELAVVTNRHVVESSEVAVVESPDGIWSATRWREHPYLDIALIDMPSSSRMRPLPLGSASAVVPGRRVYTVGHPLGESIAIQEGIVSSVEGSSLVFSAPLSTGASGSPLLDASGAVIGLCHSFVESAQNYNLALPIDFVGMPESWKIRHPEEDGNLPGYLGKIVEVKASSRRSIESWKTVVEDFPEWRKWVDETNLTRRPLVHALESAVSATRSLDLAAALVPGSTQPSCKTISVLLEKTAASLEKSWEMHRSNLERVENLRPLPSDWRLLSDATLVPEMVDSVREMSRLLKDSPSSRSDLSGLSAALRVQEELEGRWSLGLVP